MATKALKSPLIRHVTSRGYAQAAPAVKKEVNVQTAILPSKTIVAAVDNGSPLTRVTVAFASGSRHEPSNELGISHVLRSAAGFTTQNASSFIIKRKLQQIGASVSASGDREFIYYTLEGTQDNIHTAIECLQNIITGQDFRPWDLSDNVPRLKYDIASLSPQVRAVDLLHKAAFRRGLGNSLFISPKKIGQISSESLQHYVANNLTLNQCAITVVGDCLDRAKVIAQGLKLGASGQGKKEPGQYYGGDIRKEVGGDLAHVAIAVPGGAAGSPQSLALAIAAKALGNGPSTKWGTDNSPLAKAIGNIGPFAASGFNVSYSDTGLTGVVLSVPKDEAKSALKAVSALLKNPQLSADSIKAGKNLLKLQVLDEADNGGSLTEALAAQGLHTGNIKSPAEIAQQIDQISDNDVTSALAKAGKEKLSMGSVGNLSNVPYSDEL